MAEKKITPAEIAEAEKNTETKSNFYRVKENDDLQSIAKEVGKTEAELLALNKENKLLVHTGNVLPGMELKIE